MGAQDIKMGKGAVGMAAGGGAIVFYFIVVACIGLVGVVSIPFIGAYSHGSIVSWLIDEASCGAIVALPWVIGVLLTEYPEKDALEKGGLVAIVAAMIVS